MQDWRKLKAAIEEKRKKLKKTKSSVGGEKTNSTN
jgi:hypothetical protein